ncbi:MAG: family 1 glycosylhydrolase [Actinomycetota bacterium]
MSSDTSGPGFGLVVTATEVEGCSPAADWSRWIAGGRAPDSDRGGARVPFGRSWSEDLEQLAGLGATSIGLTLEWAELEPRPGEHPPESVEFRRDLLRRAAELGMEPWAYLVDRTLPGWFADDEGGFGDERARGLVWPRHIDWVGETFGDLVVGWVPQREPILQALRRHWLGTAPPGRVDPVKAAEAVRDAVLADGEAWRLLQGTAPVAAHHTARLVVGDTEDPRDNEAGPRARALEQLVWHPWIGALTEGRLQAGDLPERAVDHLRDGFDRIIVQLRPSIRVDGRGRWRHHPTDRRPGPTGLAAWPEAMGEALGRVTDELDGRTVVAAGDLGDVTDDGRARPDHLRLLLDLVEEHDVAGWWQTSPIDGYHFEHGFGLQPGLIRADRSETEAARTYRNAAGPPRVPGSPPEEESRR